MKEKIDPEPNGSINVKWNWPSQDSIIRVIYKALPGNIQENLDMDAMKDGANEPDEKFKDKSLYNYPNSYDKATEWLELGGLNYETQNYKRASFCFGIASHYITDTLQAPHCVVESGNDAQNFEVEDDGYIPIINSLEGDIKALMQNAVDKGKKDWIKWLKTKDPAIAHSEADLGASVVYNEIINIIR